VAHDLAALGVKAVVLARGLGRRMREEDRTARLDDTQQAAAAAGHKALMPVGGAHGRPFLDYVLGSLADAGCTDVCLVVAPDHAGMREHYARMAPSRVRVSYAVQQEALGTANAVLAARGFAGADPFLVLNADNLYPVGVLRALVALDGPGLPAFERASLVEESGFPPERVAQFAVVRVSDDGGLIDIVEKPGPEGLAAQGPHAFISMNVWRFDARIFDACRDVPQSTRGEFELPEAVGLAVRRGVPFRVIAGRGSVLDLSRRKDVPGVSRRLASLEPHL
jgi:glucose-1-phosphate thymidylyltransferase